MIAMKAYSYDNRRHNSSIINNTQSPRTSFALHFSNDTTNTQPHNSFEKPLTKSQPKKHVLSLFSNKQSNSVHAHELSPSQSHYPSSPSPTPLSHLPYTRIQARSQSHHPTRKTSRPFHTFSRSTSQHTPSTTRIICRLAPFSPPNASSPQISRRKSKFRFTQSIIFFSFRLSKLSTNSVGSAAIVPLSRLSHFQRILIHQLPNSLIAQLPSLLYIRMNRSRVALRAFSTKKWIFLRGTRCTP